MVLFAVPAKSKACASVAKKLQACMLQMCESMKARETGGENQAARLMVNIEQLYTQLCLMRLSSTEETFHFTLAVVKHLLYF